MLGNWFPDLNAYLWTMLWLSRPVPKRAILEAVSAVEGAEDYCSELEEELNEES